MNHGMPWSLKSSSAGLSGSNPSRGMDRRTVLRLLATGGLVMAVGPLGVRRLSAADATAAGAATDFSPSVYIKVAPDGIVTIICHRSEMGQGIRTTMPMIIADEMEADWSMCRVEQADGDEDRYASQNTDGSTSIRNFLTIYREAGAMTRALFEAAAAKTWGVALQDVKAEAHHVLHAASGRKLSFAELVGAASGLPMPDKATLRFKLPAERRWQGGVMPSIDLIPMTTGTAVYGADVPVDGVVVAMIARPPAWGRKVRKVENEATLKVRGVKQVLRLPDGDLPGAFNPLGGVAVIGENTWAAKQGRDALVIDWEAGPHDTYDSTAYRKALEASVEQSGKAGRNRGDAAAALQQAGQRIEARYYIPHLSHAPMEPLVATARMVSGRIEIWAPTQSPMDARRAVAGFLKVAVEDVTVHVTLLGGGFGRKSKPDFICEAAWLARETGLTVRVQWTREDDIRHGYFHTSAAHRLEAAFNDKGRVTAWLHRAAYPSIGATFVPDLAGPSPDELTNGASDIPFDIPNLRIEVCPARAHTRIGWYRSVNAIHHGFAIGSFVDELAHAAGRDPAAFLLDLIGAPRKVDISKEELTGPPQDYYGAPWADHPVDAGRARAVVERVKQASGWGTALPRGQGRGIAMHRSFLSYIAVVVEVTVDAAGNVTVPSATYAVDAGFVANPDRVKAQMEGALIMAMSNVLTSEISFAGGEVKQSNFHDYGITRLAAAPHNVQVEILKSEGTPGGIGEPGVPPTGAALANAIFAATGVRIRSLPVASQLRGWQEKHGTA